MAAAASAAAAAAAAATLPLAVQAQLDSFTTRLKRRYACARAAPPPLLPPHAALTSAV